MSDSAIKYDLGTNDYLVAIFSKAYGCYLIHHVRGDRSATVKYSKGHDATKKFMEEYANYKK